MAGKMPPTAGGVLRHSGGAASSSAPFQNGRAGGTYWLWALDRQPQLGRRSPQGLLLLTIITAFVSASWKHSGSLPEPTALPPWDWAAPRREMALTCIPLLNPPEGAQSSLPPTHSEMVAGELLFQPPHPELWQRDAAVCPRVCKQGCQALPVAQPTMETSAPA